MFTYRMERKKSNVQKSLKYCLPLPHNLLLITNTVTGSALRWTGTFTRSKSAISSLTTLLKGGQLLKERICFFRSKFISLRVIPIVKGLFCPWSWKQTGCHKSCPFESKRALRPWIAHLSIQAKSQTFNFEIWVTFDQGQRMILTFDTHSTSLIHLAECFKQLWDLRLQ